VGEQVTPFRAADHTTERHTPATRRGTIGQVIDIGWPRHRLWNVTWGGSCDRPGEPPSGAARQHPGRVDEPVHRGTAHDRRPFYIL